MNRALTRSRRFHASERRKPRSHGHGFFWVSWLIPEINENYIGIVRGADLLLAVRQKAWWITKETAKQAHSSAARLSVSQDFPRLSPGLIQSAHKVR